MKPETTVRLANDSKNIVAIKEASGNLEQVDEIIKNKPSDFDVLSGDDALTFSMVASGAAGAISVIGNALPKEFSRMIRLEFKGEYEPARKRVKAAACADTSYHVAEDNPHSESPEIMTSVRAVCYLWFTVLICQ